MTTNRQISNPPNLNQISHFRARLTWKEAVWVWQQHYAGMPHHVIAAMLGINQGRVAEVLTGKKHEGAQTEAGDPGLFDLLA